MRAEPRRDIEAIPQRGVAVSVKMTMPRILRPNRCPDPHSDPLYEDTMPSPVGELLLVADDSGLVAVVYAEKADRGYAGAPLGMQGGVGIQRGAGGGGSPGGSVARSPGRSSAGHSRRSMAGSSKRSPGGSLRESAAATVAATVADAREQLAAYFAGERRSFDLPLAPRGTSFQLQVWRALARIPWGMTTTYGELAAALARHGAARAVGAANARNPLSIILPCHRVVGAGGALTGYGGGLAAKRWLLEHEGVVVSGSRVLASGSGIAMSGSGT